MAALIGMISVAVGGLIALWPRRRDANGRSRPIAPGSIDDTAAGAASVGDWLKWISGIVIQQVEPTTREIKRSNTSLARRLAKIERQQMETNDLLRELLRRFPPLGTS